MRSQAVSMLDIRWWLGVFMLRSPSRATLTCGGPAPKVASKRGAAYGSRTTVTGFIGRLA